MGNNLKSKLTSLKYAIITSDLRSFANKVENLKYLHFVRKRRQVCKKNGRLVGWGATGVIYPGPPATGGEAREKVNYIHNLSINKPPKMHYFATSRTDLEIFLGVCVSASPNL